MNRINKSKLVFSLILVTYPIFNRYSSFVPYLTLSDTFLFGFWVWSLFDVKTPQKKSIRRVLLLAFYFLFQSLLGFLRPGTTSIIDSVGTCLRLFYLFISLAVLAPRYFDFSAAKKTLNIVAS